MREKEERLFGDIKVPMELKDMNSKARVWKRECESWSEDGVSVGL